MIIIQNLIEQKMEVFKKQKNTRNIKNHNQSDQLQQSNPPKLNKKIKKNHQKKGNISKAQYQADDQIAAFIDKNPTYFQGHFHKHVPKLIQKIHTQVHIRQIVSNQNVFYFPMIKENVDRQLQVYIQLLKAVRNQTTLDKLGLKSLETKDKLQLRYVKQFAQTNQEGAGIASIKRVLKENQYILLKQRLQAIPQLERVFNHYTSSKGYNQVDIPWDLLQLLTVCRTNVIAEQMIINRLNNLAPKEDLFQVSNQTYLTKQQIKSQNLQNQYIEILIIKNLDKSFTQVPLDFLSYHKNNEQYEEHNYQQTFFTILTTVKMFKTYISSKKTKTNKNVKNLLRTACTGCLTQYAQMSNPIENCPQCHARIHRYCQNVENRCHRCRYGRTSNLQKSQTSYCYICNRINEKGLMILTVTNNSPHQFAHVFCLLLHRLWSVQNQQLVGQYLKPRLQNHNCVFCENNQGIFFNCQNCNRLMHGMCAFLHGASFNLNKDGKDYKVNVNCCRSPQSKLRLSIQRKFKINYQKIIFRSDPQLQGYLKMEQDMKRN